MDETPAVPIEIRPYRPGDETAILAAFHRVFPWASRPLAEWNWQFRDCPAGLHCHLGVLPDGRVVSQFTGVPRRMKVGAGERCFAEIVDSLSDPEFRQGLRKPGLFASTVYQYVDHFGRPDRETIMYGLPNPVAYRIGNKLLGYTHLHQVELMTRDTTTAPPPPDLQGGTWTAITAFPDDTDTLWARVGAEYDVATVRDHLYLTWRFVARPGGHYRIFEMRAAGGLLTALIVLRHAWLEKETGVKTTAVAEWVVDRRHPQTKAVPGAIEREAAAEGATRVQLLFRPGCDEGAHMGEVGYHAEPSQFRLVGRTYDAAVVPLDRLRDHWFYTLGDFDIV